MSIESLCRLHSVTPYPLVATQNATRETIETLGEAETPLDCRALSVHRGVEEDADQKSLPKRMLFRFSSNPGLTLSHALLFDEEVYRVTDVDDASQMNRLWRVTAEHVPQLEVTA